MESDDLDSHPDMFAAISVCPCNVGGEEQIGDSLGFCDDINIFRWCKEQSQVQGFPERSTVCRVFTSWFMKFIVFMRLFETFKFFNFIKCENTSISMTESSLLFDKSMLVKFTFEIKAPD